MTHPVRISSDTGQWRSATTPIIRDTPNANCPQGDNTCIYIIPRDYNRFAVTREINDGILAPRFANSTRGWVLAGPLSTGFAPIGASEGRDSDDR